VLRDLLKWLRGTQRRDQTIEIRRWSEGPAPLVLETLSGQPNPILKLADDWRLPRTDTRSLVIQRVGVSRDPFYRSETILLPEAAALPGTMSPWSANAFEGIPPQFPISRFSTLVWFDDDAHGNLRRTADYLSERFGSAQIGQRWNTLVASWMCGLAQIDLISFPPEWQSGSLRNDAHDREPRLRTTCRVNVATGFVPTTTGKELGWIESFRPVRFKGLAGMAREARVGTTAPFETEMEYVRDASSLAPGIQSRVGFSANDDALILVSSQLYVVPRTKLIRFDVTRLTPAKGGGGSTLHTHCQTEAPGIGYRPLLVAQSSEPDGMNRLAEELGKRFGCPVEIGPYYPDV